MTDETMRAELGDEAVNVAIRNTWDRFAGGMMACLTVTPWESAIYRAAIAHERTRCAAIARKHGRDDIATEINRGEQ